MSSLKHRLRRIESRLQNLVEGGAKRLVPGSHSSTDLTSHLLAAFKTGGQSDGDGLWLAPDLVILIVHPEDARILLEDQVLIEEMTASLQEVAIAEGWHFRMPLKIKISPDPTLERHQIRIRTHISPINIDETNKVELESANDEEVVPSNAFLILNGKQIYPLDLVVVNIGRRPDNHLVIDDPRVSRLHAQLRAINGRYVIFDVGSTGGTSVNGMHQKQCTLYPGDVISLAGVNLIYGQDAGFGDGSEPGGTQPITPFPPAS